MRQNETKWDKMSKKEQKWAKKSKKEQEWAKKAKKSKKEQIPRGGLNWNFNCYIVCGDWIRWFFVLGGLDPRGFSCNNGLRSEGFFHATQRSTEITISFLLKTVLHLEPKLFLNNIRFNPCCFKVLHANLSELQQNTHPNTHHKTFDPIQLDMFDWWQKWFWSHIWNTIENTWLPVTRQG